MTDLRPYAPIASDTACVVRQPRRSDGIGQALRSAFTPSISDRCDFTALLSAIDRIDQRSVNHPR